MGLPQFVEHEFRDFLMCGVFEGGVARSRCEDCALEHLVQFRLEVDRRYRTSSEEPAGHSASRRLCVATDCRAARCVLEVKTVKAVHVDGKGAIELDAKAIRFADAVLLDTKAVTRIGGTGVTHVSGTRWRRYRQSSRPYPNSPARGCIASRSFVRYRAGLTYSIG